LLVERQLAGAGGEAGLGDVVHQLDERIHAVGRVNGPEMIPQAGPAVISDADLSKAG
jgi:hypothetical protein